jgi:hypothetical protein
MWVPAAVHEVKVARYGTGIRRKQRVGCSVGPQCIGAVETDNFCLWDVVRKYDSSVEIICREVAE